MGGEPSLSWKRFADFVAIEMHSPERPNVVGSLLAELHDVFAKVRLENLEALLFQSVIQMDFLRRHALGLDDGGGLTMLPGDLEDVIARVARAGSPENFRAARCKLGCELFEISVEMINRIPLDSRSRLARAWDQLVGEAVLEFASRLEVIPPPEPTGCRGSNDDAPDRR